MLVNISLVLINKRKKGKKTFASAVGRVKTPPNHTTRFWIWIGCNTFPHQHLQERLPNS